MGFLFLLLLALCAAPGLGGEPVDEATRWPGPRTVMGTRSMLEPAVLEAIAPVRIGGIQWGGAIYPGDVGAPKVKRLAAYVARAHEVGAKYIGSINGPGFHLRSLPGEAMLTLDGRPQTRADSQAKVFKCLLRPKVFSALLETAQRSVDLGMDGFVLPLAKKPLPAAAKEALARYVKAGGHLVRASEFPRGRKGNPRIWDLLPYRKDRDPALRKAFVRALGTEPVIATDASADVGLLAWQAGGRTLIHLVNQAYVEKEDRVVDQESIHVRVPFAASRATFHSPGERAPIPLEPEKDASGTSVTVPRLHVYGVVVLE